MIGVNQKFDIYWLQKNCNQVEVWSNILGIDSKYLSIAFKSPFREDNNPDCFLFKTNNNQLVLVDFARPDKGGSIIKILREEFYLTDRQIRDYLCSYLNKNDDISIFTREKSTIKGTIKNYTERDLKYWNNYNITENHLNKLNVLSLDKIMINEKIIYPSMAFGYTFLSGNKRIYQPLNRYHKFVGNANSDDIYFEELLEQCKDKSILYITSGFKDAIILNSISKHPAIAFSTEKVIPKDEILDKILTGFNHVIVIYDNDSTGYTQSEILIDKIKDKCQKISNFTMELKEKDLALEVRKNKEIKWLILQ